MSSMRNRLRSIRARVLHHKNPGMRLHWKIFMMRINFRSFKSRKRTLKSLTLRSSKNLMKFRKMIRQMKSNRKKERRLSVIKLLTKSRHRFSIRLMMIKLWFKNHSTMMTSRNNQMQIQMKTQSSQETPKVINRTELN